MLILALACREFIEALEKCHGETTWAKFLGLCNTHKDQLNKCLRSEVRVCYRI